MFSGISPCPSAIAPYFCGPLSIGGVEIRIYANSNNPNNSECHLPSNPHLSSADLPVSLIYSGLALPQQNKSSSKDTEVFGAVENETRSLLVFTEANIPTRSWIFMTQHGETVGGQISKVTRLVSGAIAIAVNQSKPVPFPAPV